MAKFLYSDTNKRYHTLDYDMKKRFGGKVYKVPLDLGLSCPNIDGRCGYGGCIYCSGRGSGDFAPSSLLSIEEQYEISRSVYLKKHPEARFIAYFQAHTNTYAPLAFLKESFEKALTLPGVVGLDIATRADCLEEDVLDYLAALKKKTHLTVELGLQTVHDETAAFINRGHDYKTFLEGYEKLKARGIDTVIHLIAFLPGETEDMMRETVRRVAALSPYGVKLHLLYVLKGTPLARLYEEGRVALPTREAYVRYIADAIERLPADTVIARVTGDAPRECLVAPLWSKNKIAVLNAIDKELAKRETFQGFFVESAQK